MANRRVVLAGASGLVGSSLLAYLLQDGSVTEVHVLSRRPLDVSHPKLTMQLVNFKSLPALPPVDEIYLALGTTIKQAGSQAAFRAVDFEANLAVAQAGLAAGATRLGLVSAMGANANASIFYNRVKGELEEALSSLAFQTLIIARPSLIIGDREKLNQPRRLGEKVGVWLSKLFNPLLPMNYKAVDATKIALALVSEVPMHQGRRVLLSGEIQSFNT
ncbi:MAG TPA: NAD-dependent epimerase/dehydratase family protein [Methylophilus sp.]|nr:NAD-dependent epimerase/dehydratase family protein [Methylophilus sp.]